jgi:hypothetical protein
MKGQARQYLANFERNFQKMQWKPAGIRRLLPHTVFFERSNGGLSPAGPETLSPRPIRMDDPIHRDLNTAFVDLGALVRHLVRKHFVGRLHLAIGDYEADIKFVGTRLLHAREFDHASGRITQGQKALVSIIAAARKPGGRIDVFADPTATGREQKAYVDQAIKMRARNMIANLCDKSAVRSPVFRDKRPPRPAEFAGAIDIREWYSEEQWEEFLGLAAELLQAIDVALAKANIHFPDAFRTACGLVADEHPFLDPDHGGFSYRFGSVTMSGRVPPEKFWAGITAVTERIFERLSEHEQFRQIRLDALRRLGDAERCLQGDLERLGMTRHVRRWLARLAND